MFAGKTTALINHIAVAAASRGITRTLVFKPARDTRYDAHSEIVTHSGKRLPATAIVDTAEITLAPNLADTHIAIDEAHFFGNALIAPVTLALTAGASLTIAGLERDHRGQPFDPFPWLLCEADEIIKLTSPCARCGQPAIHSQRLVASADRIVVGGSEAYEPRCRACFVPGK